MPRPKGSLNKIKRVRSLTVSPNRNPEIWIDRSTGIANDEVSAVLNRFGYCSRALWYNKKGYQKDYDNTPALKHRELYEAHMKDIARRYYHEDAPTRLIRRSPKDYRSNIKYHMVAYVNDLIISRKLQKNFPLLFFIVQDWELYHAQHVDLFSFWKENIQHVIYVKNSDWCGVCIMGEGREMVLTDIERDDRIISEITTACDNWWFEYFVPNVIPPAIPLGATCHLCSWRITCRPDIYNAKELSYDPVLNDLTNFYFRIEKGYINHQWAMQDVARQISNRIPLNGEVKTIYGTLKHKMKKRLLLNSQKILEAYPEVRAKYATTSEKDELIITPWFVEASIETPDVPSS